MAHYSEAVAQPLVLLLGSVHSALVRLGFGFGLGLGSGLGFGLGLEFGLGFGCGLGFGLGLGFGFGLGLGLGLGVVGHRTSEHQARAGWVLGVAE